MESGRADAIATGKWLAKERSRRTRRGKTLSAAILARFANTYIERLGLPVKRILQQEIAALENATPDKGPKRRQPWWKVLTDFIESGELDAMLAAYDGSLTEADADVIVSFWEEKAKRGETTVRNPDGEVVGKIVWTRGQ